MENRVFTLGLTTVAVVAVASSLSRSPASGRAGAAYPVADTGVVAEAGPSRSQGQAGAPGRSGQALLREFLGLDRTDLRGSAPDTFDLGALIATLPDPYDSHLDWTFDQALEAIRRAFETAGYVVDRFWLPGARNSITAGPDEDVLLREVQPGVMLFRGPRSLRLLYLVPELPSRGVSKTALLAALREWDALRHVRGALRPDTSGPVRIIGPAFSGSALSLQFALRSWLANHPGDSARIVSGSATSMANLQTLDLPALRIRFRATVNSDQALLRVLTQSVLPCLGLKPSQVALLRESSTQYGQALRRAGRAGEQGTGEACRGSSAPADTGHFVDIPFPMSISSLRSEYQRLPAAAAQPALPGTAEAPRLPLDLLEPVRPREDFPVTSRLSPVALDLMLDDLARTLARRDIRLVGLLATDVRDKLFLGEEIRKRVRDVQFFTLESNILYLRPERSQALRGMLVLSTYPLILENQWNTSDSSETRRFAFGSDGAEGVYNATLLQLDSTRSMLDYRPTRKSDTTHRPPVWLSTVGSGTFLPISAYPVTKDDAVYVARGCDAATPCATPAVGWPELHLPFLILTAILLACFGLGLVAFRSLLADWELRSARAAASTTTDFDVRPLRERVMEGSLKLHGRLYGLLRVVAIAGVFLAAAAPALGLLRSRPAEGLFLVLAVSIALAASLGIIAVVTGCTSVGWLFRRLALPGWQYFWGGPWADWSEKWSWRVEVAARTLVALYGVAYLSLSLAFAADITSLSPASTRGSPADSVRQAPAANAQGDTATRPERPRPDASPRRGGFWLFFRRAIEIDSLVSPILPLVLAGLAYAVWCSWHLQRIALLRSRTTFESACEAELDRRLAPRLTFRSALRDDLRRSAAVVRGIRLRLFRVIPSKGALVVLAAFLLLAGWIVPQFGRSLEAVLLGYRGLPAFDWLFRVTVLAMLFATAWGAFRLVAVWQGLRQCLETFARMPVVTAFDRLPPRLARLTRLTLPGHISGASVGAVADLQWLHLQRIHAAKRAEFAAALEPDHRAVARRVELLMQEPAAEASRLDRVGRQALIVRFGELHDVLRELWRLEPMLPDVEALNLALAKEFDRPDAATGPAASTASRIRRGFAGPVRLWLRAAEEYVGTRMVEYVEWVTRHLRVLALFMLLSLVLATLFLSSYPYPPQSLLRMVLLVVMLGSVGSLVFVLVQMNRDEVLSRIDRTEPGKVTWNMTFVLNLLTFGAVPLLTLLSSEFPELRQLLFAWVDPLVKVLVKQ